MNTESNSLVSRRGLLRTGAGLLLATALRPLPGRAAGSSEYRIVAAPAVRVLLVQVVGKPMSGPMTAPYLARSDGLLSAMA